LAGQPGGGADLLATQTDVTRRPNSARSGCCPRSDDPFFSRHGCWLRVRNAASTNLSLLNAIEEIPSQIRQVGFVNLDLRFSPASNVLTFCGLINLIQTKNFVSRSLQNK